MPERCAAKLTIRNRLGLHARPAMAFVDTANAYTSNVRIHRGEEDVDGKSIMEIMLLAATQGTEIEVIVEGNDAAACLADLSGLVNRGFDEE